MRAPSASVLRVMDVCRLNDLVGPGAEMAEQPIDLKARAVPVEELVESG